MLTLPERPRDETEPEQPFNGTAAEAEFEAAFKPEEPAPEEVSIADEAEKVFKSKAVDDDSPLSFEEFVEVGKQALARIKEIPLKPLRRGVRETLDSLFGAVESASESVERKHLGSKDKSK